MQSLFSPRANLKARVTLFVLVCLLAGVPLALMGWVRTPYASRQYAHVSQPIAFDHTVHARGLGIDCRYCHALADRSPTAGIPPTSACVPCHNEAFMSSNVLAPVKASLESGRPIAWNRVNALPGFVYFDHSVHVRNGLTCETCHGQVDKMPVVYQAKPMTMGWCVSCHRQTHDPRLTDCSACHR